MSIFVVLLVFMFLVFVHELGHFVVAKYMGVAVVKFSIGFGMFGALKPIYQKTYKGTNYLLYPTLFLGGYIQMKGQEDGKPTHTNDDSDSYSAKKPHQRIAILLGGPLANILLAFVLYFAMSLIGVKAISPTIGKVSPNSPAELAGLLVDDKIVRINGKPVQKWSDVGYMIENSTGNIKIGIQRPDGISSVVLTPKMGKYTNRFNEPAQKKLIGIAPKPIVIDINYGIGDGLVYALESTTDACTMIFTGIGKLIFGSVSSSEVGGVITIANIINDASKVGVVAIFGIMALISVNLGILNLLPIPVLDGGHIVFNIYEWIKGKKPSDRAIGAFASVGLIVLLFLMLLGFYNDINRYF